MDGRGKMTIVRCILTGSCDKCKDIKLAIFSISGTCPIYVLGRSNELVSRSNNELLG